MSGCKDPNCGDCGHHACKNATYIATKHLPVEGSYSPVFYGVRHVTGGEPVRRPYSNNRANFRQAKDWCTDWLNRTNGTKVSIEDSLGKVLWAYERETPSPKPQSSGRGGYENAPSTKLQATHCAFCSRPLTDAQSTATGVGPVCRKKYGVADHLTETEREIANKVIYKIAAKQTGPDVVRYLAVLEEMGMGHVVGRIRKRLPYPVKISYEGERFRVKTAYGAVEDFRGWVSGMARAGGKYEGKGKGNTFPMSARRQVWELMRDHFAGMVGLGPKGEIRIQ